MVEWHSMEIAPRDGTEFIWYFEGTYAIIYWPKYEGCFETGGKWTPLPEPPPES